MPLLLPNRDTQSRERMDDPDCDRDDLFHTYEQFSVVNSLISRWKSVYQHRIRPLCSEPGSSYSLLDIGFGGGDLVQKLSSWAGSDGISLDITAIDTDPRALDFINRIDTPDNISFRCASSTELVKQGEVFDFVISNHLLHHLDRTEFEKLMSESKSLSRKRVLFNDIERSDLAYLFFGLLARPMFRSSFITEDGLTSIKRSYTAGELRNAVPDSWGVSRLFPFRLLLEYRHD